MGCGPGVQTVDLLKNHGGCVLALDFLPLRIERTRSSAARAGVSERLEVLEQDMKQVDFQWARPYSATCCRVERALPCAWQAWGSSLPQLSD